MTMLSRFNLSPISRRARVFSAIASALLISVAGPAVLAQNSADEAAKRRRGNPADENSRRGGSPEDLQTRMLSSLRERLEVPDDEEWKVISERLGKLMELRRATAGGGGGFPGFVGRGPQGGGSDNNRGGRGTRPGGTPEMTALQSAIRDKLPDAEIKSRLDRFRESRKDAEGKLSKAQEELRAVLSV